MIALLTAALLLQDQAAEEEFRKIEEAFRTATTVRVKYHVEGKVTEKKKTSAVKAEGLLLIKGDRKVLLQNRIQVEGEDSPEPDGVLVSDGEKACTSFSSSSDPRRTDSILDAPKDLRDRIGRTPIDAGMLGLLILARQADLWKALRGPLFPNLAKLGSVTDVTSSQADGCRVFKFRVAAAIKEAPEFDCTLHVGEGMKLVKRVLTLKGRGDVAGQFTEVYDEFVLNGDIPDEAFATELAAGKKRIENHEAGRKTWEQLQKIHDALAKYEADAGKYPTTEQGLGALLKKPDGVKEWKGPYVTAELLTDPWGKPLVYRFPSKNNPEVYFVFSSGPDGKPDTADDVPGR